MAIVNGKSGTFNISTKNQYISGYVHWQETYDDSTYISTNKSTVTITAYLHRTNIYSGSTYITNTQGRRTAYFGTESVTDESNITLSIAGNTSSSGGPYTKVYTASKEIAHNSDGTKNLSIGFYMWNIETGSGANAFIVPTTRADITLTKIPRYATSNQSLKSATETTISMDWSSDSIIDYVWYSTDWGTTWKDVGSVNATSGSYTITTPSNSANNLSANTTYNVITRVRRKDSQLATNSSKLSVTTYDYPHCTDSPNFTIGNILTLKFYNPLGRTISIYVIGDNGAEVGGATTNGTSISGYNYNEIIDWWYGTIPNKQSGTYQVKVVYDSVVKTKVGGTYSIKGTETPTVGTFTYKDNNSSTVNITEDNQRIIRNHSHLLFTTGTSTPFHGASISKYEVIFNGITKSITTAGNLDFGTVNVANNLDATLKITDSRGLSVTKSITVVVDNWEIPNALISLNRKNNFYSETYLKVDGSCSYINGKNDSVIQYQYKKVTDSNYTEYEFLSDNVQTTLDLDNEHQWNIRVRIADRLGEATYNLVLDRGMPIAYFDRLNSAVGVNAIPKNGEALRVAKGDVPIDGKLTVNDVKCKNLFNHNNLMGIGELTQNNKEFSFDSTFWYGNIVCGGEFKVNKPYTFSFNIIEMSMSTTATFIFFYTDGSLAEKSVDVLNIGKYSITLTPTKEIDRVELRFFRLDNNTTQRTGKVTDIQVEESDTATEYTSYKNFENPDWKQAIDNGNDTYTVPISWNNLKEISFRTLGTDSSSFSYITIPKEQWHNDGSYSIQAVCFDTGGTYQGYRAYAVIQKNIDNFVIQRVGTAVGTQIYYK